MRLEGLNRRVDIREHRTDRHIRLDYMILVRIRRAVGKPRAHRVLSRHVVDPHPERRRRTGRSVKARCNVRPDDKDAIPRDWIQRIGMGRRRESDRCHTCNDHRGKCWGHFLLQTVGHPCRSVCPGMLQQQQLAPEIISRRGINQPWRYSVARHRMTWQRCA